MKRIKQNKPASTPQIEPIIIPRTEHTISRNAISPHALKVLYRLHNANFSAYLVGGCVRDLLLGRKPKDFDIATNALPEEVRQLFRNCRIIGRRFRLAHIVFGKEIIEVATFRTHHENATHEHHAQTHKGMIVRDNVYGLIEDDVFRRDFTVNALYYNIADFSIVDYANGMPDIRLKLLRMIGHPEKRFHEDPVRLLRAVRFMGKLKLGISPDTETSLYQLSHLLHNVSPARLYQEILKFFQEGATLPTFQLLRKYHLFKELFPQSHASLNHPVAQKLIETALADSDKRIQEGKFVSPAFLFTIFLWYPISEQANRLEEEGLPNYVAFEKAIQTVLKEQTQRLAIPRRILMTVREICMLQHRFTQRQGTRPHRLLEHPRFRAGYDLLGLRALAGEPMLELSQWWIQFYESPLDTRENMLKELTKQPAAKKTRRPRRRKPSSAKKPPIFPAP